MIDDLFHVLIPAYRNRFAALHININFWTSSYVDTIFFHFDLLNLK